MDVMFFGRQIMRQLLIVPMFSWALFSFSCQQKDDAPVPVPVSAVDVSVQDPPTPANPGDAPSSKPAGPPSAEPPEPAPTEGVTSLSIQVEGAFLIGHRKKLRAIAHYEEGTSREVPAQWTLITNEADATLEADGHLRAKKTGKVSVRAGFGGQLAEAEFRIEEPVLRHKEDQFWVYRLNRDYLSFNTPWDKETGHGIVRSPGNIANFAKDCLDQAKQSFSLVHNEPSMKERFGALIGNGATVQLIFLVNVVPLDGRRNDLRRLDRDAYFWHWTREDARPSLAMSRFQQGSWVWEVIASPSECLQPDIKEILRYLDYVALRIVHVQ